MLEITAHSGIGLEEEVEDAEERREAHEEVGKGGFQVWMMNGVGERAYRWADEEGQQVDCPNVTSEGQKQKKSLMLKMINH